MRNPKPSFVAEAWLAALKRRGVDWIFGNAGTDFAPVIEALAREDRTGLSFPRAVAVAHETVAVAMAHGFYLATGRPQVAMVHVNVGTANALMGLMNAARGQVPVLFASGRTPVTESGRTGSRNAPIHWGQEMFDQGGLVREFVKWDTELRAGEQVCAVVDRAYAVAMSEPRGPTYMSLPREVLAEPLSADFEAPAAVAVPSPPHPCPDAIDAAARALAAAELPLIVSSLGGQDVFPAVTALAERFAIPVTQFWRVAACISTEHPLYAGETPRPLLARADVVVVLNSMVPWMPDRMPLRAGAKVIEIGPDPLFQDIQIRGFQSDINIHASVAPAVRALHARLEALGAGDAAHLAERRRTLVPELQTRRARELAAGDAPGGEPMTPEFATRVLYKTLDKDAIVVNELGLGTSIVQARHWDSYFAPSVAGGLGWGVGAALGVKAAHPDRTVVAATGDGSFEFANPSACLRTAHNLGLAILIVVADNGVWNAVRRSTIAVYPDGTAAGLEAMPLSQLGKPVDYAKLAQAYGGYGECVSTPAALAPALERALAATRAGQHALVAVRCSYPNALKQ